MTSNLTEINSRRIIVDDINSERMRTVLYQKTGCCKAAFNCVITIDSQ